MMKKQHTEISLEGLEFFAYHGYYPEEQSKGNIFLVDIKVISEIEPSLIYNLEKTINYEILFGIVEREMGKTTALLETVANGILDQVFILIKQAQQAEVTVSKLNPPIQGKCARAKVLMRRCR
jgi:7,8-dihydroneopterin aldolase/epimerase/oxygenase